MILLTAQNLVKEYDGEALFKPFTFSIDEGERIALIGQNGCGKTTLLKMLIGELEPDKGLVSISKNTSIGYLSQNIISNLDNTLYEEAHSVFDHLKDKEKQLNELCQKIENNPQDSELLALYARKQNEFEQLEGYTYEYKIRMILNYFNFKEEDYHRPITTFSGGERMKLAFAKLLLLKPSILILDEPTNHIDISTIEWLETYLKTYQGSILFISHDRYFINAIANKILEMDNGSFEVYHGDYDKYCIEKKARFEQRLKQYQKDEKERKHLEWFINFYMPKPRFVSRAHDREKKLARLEANRIEKPIETKNKVHINLGGAVRKGKRLFEVKDLSIGYCAGQELVKDINFLFFGGDRLAVMGENGAGKTTFIKTLLGVLKPLHGHINRYDDFSIGYLPQDGLMIQSQKTIFEYFHDQFDELLPQDIFNLLGSFDFSYEDDQKIIDNLSGGEKMRVVLATLVIKKYDLLIMDEPTNHLDMMTKVELQNAIKRYKGSLILISHDRAFVDELADHLLYFENHKAYFYIGDYSHFKAEKLDDVYAEKALIEKLQLEKEKREQEEERQLIDAVHKINEPKIKKNKPSLSKNKIEEKLVRLESKIEASVKNLDDPLYYHDQAKLALLQDEIFELNTEYEKLLEMLSLYDE